MDDFDFVISLIIIIMIGLLAISAVIQTENKMNQNTVAVTPNGVICRNFVEFACGFTLSDCEDGRILKCATNIQLVEMNPHISPCPCNEKNIHKHKCPS